MSSKAAFSAMVAVIVGATLMIAGPSFAATPKPTPAPAKSTAAARKPTPTAAPAPAESRRATQAKPVRSRPNFTG